MEEKRIRHTYNLNKDLFISVFGVNNAYYNIIKEQFNTLSYSNNGKTFCVEGMPVEISLFKKRFDNYLEYVKNNFPVEEQIVSDIISGKQKVLLENNENKPVVHTASGVKIKAKTPGQQQYVSKINTSDVSFGIGPAGTGKTFLAVAIALQKLKKKEVKKVVLTRPAVEAGENLGFLPGDIREKLDPYMQPLYDSLSMILTNEKLKTYIEESIIEIAPLAYMRGRTLTDAFVILDEAQNVTYPQLKMFLTRLGKNSKFVITGDLTQIDLPKNQDSGLKKIIDLLQSVPEVSVISLSEIDNQRNPLVKKFISIL